MPKQLRKCLQVATFKSFLVKSGLRFALGPLVSSERFGSVFLDPTEPNNAEPKLRYSVNSVQFGSVGSRNTEPNFLMKLEVLEQI